MKKILFLVLNLVLTNTVFTQQASDYFPADIGYKWMFRLTLLDSMNQPVPSAFTFKVDSFATTSDYFGREAKYIVSKSGSEEILPLMPYTDSIFVSLSGTEAFEYYRNGGFSGILNLLDSLGLDSSFSFVNLFQSFKGWYSKYRFASNVNSNYTIFSYDTSITYDSTTLPLRFSFRGKRLDDENLQTAIGNFNCKKFTISNVISYLVTFPPPIPPLAVPILTFVDSVWIAPSNWIVKEFAPSTNIDFSILGFPMFTIPGYSSEIMTIPTSVEENYSILNDYHLYQNYPNPFNPSTKIKYTVGDAYYASPAWVTLKVYDILGNEVTTLVNEKKSAGTYEVEFNSTTKNYELASGVYYYRLTAGSPTNGKAGYIETKKMILVR